MLLLKYSYDVLTAYLTAHIQIDRSIKQGQEDKHMFHTIFMSISLSSLKPMSCHDRNADYICTYDMCAYDTQVLSLYLLSTIFVHMICALYQIHYNYVDTKERSDRSDLLYYLIYY